MEKDDIIKQVKHLLEEEGYDDVDIVEGDVLFNDLDGNAWAVSVSAV